MPKGKRKGKSDRFRNEASSDEDSYPDNGSVTSGFSEHRSVEDGAEDGVEESSLQDQLEDKLVDMIDALGQKSAQGRISALDGLKAALQKKLIGGFVRERHFTICDAIERCLKRGAAAEKAAAADLVPVVALQMDGEEDGVELVDKALRGILLAMACDGAVGFNARAKCCLALGTLVFLSGDQLGDVLSVMQALENIYSGSYLKGDGSIPNISPELANLHAAALNSWTLLLTNFPTGALTDLIESKALPSLEQLSDLLESPHLEVRLTAGEALALIFEEGRKEDLEFAEDFALQITDVIKNLATDSHKYRAKKDRKQQRATFRDILSFIEDDVVPDMQVKFGREVLVLDTWVRRKQYETLCGVLGSGINAHLAENNTLRDIFAIVAPFVATENLTLLQHNAERFKKRQMNAAAFKARTISRGKNRDKRSDF